MEEDHAQGNLEEFTKDFAEKVKEVEELQNTKASSSASLTSAAETR